MIEQKVCATADSVEEAIKLLNDGFELLYTPCRWTLPSERGQVDLDSHHTIERADDWEFDGGWHRVVDNYYELTKRPAPGTHRRRIKWEHVKSFRFEKVLEAEA